MKKDQTLVRQHRKCQETPVLIYNSLKIYSTSCSRNIIDHFLSIGISVSYDKILELTQNIYEHLRESYYNHNCFFPKVPKQSIFTIMMKDNIGMNARSTFVKSHYHTTSLWIVQFPTNKNPDINLANVLSSEQSKNKSEKLSPLPAEYVNIKTLFILPGITDKRLWAPLCSINFEDLS